MKHNDLCPDSQICRKTLSPWRHPMICPLWCISTIILLVFFGTIGLAGIKESDTAASAGVVINDVFGRDIREQGLTLVDWEGHLANPAVTFMVTPPAGSSLPVKAELSSKAVRLYFDMPAKATANGPYKILNFNDAKAQIVNAAIFPDRDGGDEKHTITIRFTDNKKMQTTMELPVCVIDQDQPDRGGGFPFVLDFSQDKTGFFKEEKHRKVVEQAAEDWGYFLDGSGIDETLANTEMTLIWPPENFENGTMTTNKKAYTGFLIYAYGIHTPEVRSGGEPSHEGGLLKRNGQDLHLKRSGGLEMEIRGNFNTLGWMVSLNPEEWWKASNLRDVKNDLYSIVRHEMGHTICYNASHPGFRKWFDMKKIDEKQLVAYQGQPVTLKHDHFPGVVDRLSKRGIFGNEFHGDMPRKRWLITKLDLLIMQACGWQLLETSAFAPLDLVTRELKPIRDGLNCTLSLKAKGGLPAYDWAVSTGELPPGLALNHFTGVLSGTPRKTGTFTFIVNLRDSDERTPAVTREFSLKVHPGPCIK